MSRNPKTVRARKIADLLETASQSHLPDTTTFQRNGFVNSYSREGLPEIVLVPIEALRSNPSNARTHSKKQLRKIQASVEQFGQTKPVIADDNNVILAGQAGWDREILAIELGELSELGLQYRSNGRAGHRAPTEDSAMHELEHYVRCKNSSRLQGRPCKRSYLVALRQAKISASDPASAWRLNEIEVGADLT